MKTRPSLAVPAAIAFSAFFAAITTPAVAQDRAAGTADSKAGSVTPATPATVPAPAKSAAKPQGTPQPKAVAERHGEPAAAPNTSPAEERKFKSCSDHASDA